MKEGSPYEKKQGGEGGEGEELKTCSWWVTRGCNYRDVRGRVLSQSASARSVSEPPRKRGFAPAGRIFNRVLNKESLSTKRERVLFSLFSRESFSFFRDAKRITQLSEESPSVKRDPFQ